MGDRCPRVTARRRARALFGISVALTILACRRPPPAVLREATEGAHSWIAGAEMAVDLWTAGLVPSPLARIAVRDAQRGLETQRASLGRRADVMKDPRVAEAVRALDAASVAASRLGAALARDGGEVAASREALRAADRALQAAGGR